MTAEITMADAITALVTEQRAVGYKYAAEARVLARFAAFRDTEFPGLQAPTRAAVEAWVAAAGRRDVTPATLRTCEPWSRRCASWPGGLGAGA